TALSGAAYRIRKRDEFIQTVGKLYLKLPQLDDGDGVLVRRLYKDYLRDKNITAEEMEKYDAANKIAWNAWMKARKENDFSLFADSLEHRIHLDIERTGHWDAEAVPGAKCIYDRMLDEYETGMSTEIFDKLFDECRERIFNIMEKIHDREAKVRTDFLNIRVTDAQQTEITEYLLDLMEFDRSRGAWSLTTHPFTDRIGRNDTRITTNFEPDNFLANIYTVIHECGHALFEQLQPAEDYNHHIEDFKSMGQHESVSRFYENIIGRSAAFIHLIYPKICEVFPDVMKDVSEKELYEAVNHVQPSLIRTDADELTYTLHIMIRYELEREMAAGRIHISDLPKLWAEKYEHYLEIRPADDLTGVLQDVHWTDCLGYFPTYALGNFYGGMYLSKMQEEFDPFESLSEYGFGKINSWMKAHVFAKANRLEPAAWIKDITGRELTAADYLDYLEKKYLQD
ncbi:MAG: carboxypeptidase M32, partial [Lachnospiraceae bacterium]|nr:carboxypeptidase M32 [Lachnospiraceae bacterium]